ncbi:basic salivary proline-rich protein 1-like [Macrobrachium nipponense]|uniref:basic salivary proline-rich protein 1-like n=1 Tax=Macrobrachium nipponense TaxID=159736 RepID=UPI0030C8420E
MAKFRALLVSLSFASIWMTSQAQGGMSLLSQVLPRDTFLIGNPIVRPDGAFINAPPPPPHLSPVAPFRQAALAQRVRDSSQDPVFHRPVLPHQNYPLQVNPLRQDQQRRDQLRPSTSRFSVDQQVPQLPVVPPRADIPQTPLFSAASGSPSRPQTVPQRADIPQTPRFPAASGSPLRPQTVPQRATVPETSFGSSGGDFPTSVHQPGNTQSNPPRSPPTKTQVASSGSFTPSGVTHNFPVNPQQKPLGQTPRRHPMCGVTPPTGDCRAAFPRYYYNPPPNGPV